MTANPAALNPKNKHGWKQGYYVPIHPKKFIGILDKIGVPYRSSLEWKFLKMIDNNPDVIRWTYEHKDTAIRYYDPIKEKYRNYYPDFYLEMMVNRKLRIFLIEVKPENQTVYPDRSKFPNTKAYQKQLAINALVEVKRRAALDFCKGKGWTYLFITEKFFKK